MPVNMIRLANDVGLGLHMCKSDDTVKPVTLGVAFAAIYLDILKKKNNAWVCVSECIT